jgi:hypothetical protein
MTNILLGIYFILSASIVLFELTVDPKLLALIALVVGVLLLFAPYAHRLWPRPTS